FSTEWFRAPGQRADLGRRIQTSGHILEWLSYSLPADSLTDPPVVKAVEYLSGVLHEGKAREWEIGPLGHALHSLAIYDSRVFKPLDNPDHDATVAVTPPVDESTAEGESSDAEATHSAVAATGSASAPRVTQRQSRTQGQRSGRRAAHP